VNTDVNRRDVNTDVNSHERLLNAELLFKFAVGMSAASHTSDALLIRPSDVFTWGKHRVEGAEMALTKPQEQWASVVSEYCATFLLMLQLDRTLQDAIPNRFQHVNMDVRAAAWVARTILAARGAERLVERLDRLRAQRASAPIRDHAEEHPRNDLASLLEALVFGALGFQERAQLGRERERAALRPSGTFPRRWARQPSFRSSLNAS
jgi:hypothetical protein